MVTVDRYSGAIDLPAGTLCAPCQQAKTAGHFFADAPKARCAMQPETSRFNEWFLAGKEASEAESQLYRVMLDSAKDGCVPDPGLVQAARARRAKARSLFDDAMGEMRTLAESLHHRRIKTSSSSVGYERERAAPEGHEAPPESA